MIGSAERNVVKNSVIVFDLKGTLVPNTGDFCIRANTPGLLKGYRNGNNRLFVTASKPEVLNWGYPKFLVQQKWVQGAILALKGNNDGKSYMNTANAAELKPEEAAKRMIITGSSFGDRPNDLDGVVLVVHPDGYKYDALVHRDIITSLYKEGKGNFQLGFEEWMSKGQQFGTREDPFIGLALDRSVCVRLRRMVSGTYPREVSNPIVEIIAPSRRKKPNYLSK